MSTAGCKTNNAADTDKENTKSAESQAKGEQTAALRIYLGKEEVFSGAWLPPVINEIQ